MQPPLKETIIFQQTLAGQNFEIIDTSYHRSLYFNNRTLQSRQFFTEQQHLALSYTRHMAFCLTALHSAPKRILILGLGGGSLIHFFSHFYPECEIDAVEIEPHVTAIAEAYFGVNETNTIHIHQLDGAAFLRETPLEPYDIIMLDAFDGNGMSREVYKKSVFSECRQHLKPNGLLVSNLWSGNAKTLSHVQNSLHSIFGDNVVIPVPDRGNLITISMKEKFPWKNIFGNRAGLLLMKEKYQIDFPAIAKIAINSNLSFVKKMKLSFLN